MSRKIVLGVAVALIGAGPVSAMTHTNSSPAFAGRAAAVDPDERLSRLAATNTPQDRSHAKPARSMRNILKDDPYLKAAFASLDNK